MLKYLEGKDRICNFFSKGSTKIIVCERERVEREMEEAKNLE